MKNKLIALIAATIFTGCATAVVIGGAAVQIIACELAKSKPAAKAPLLAGGNIFKAFGSDVPPTQAELEAALSAIPKLDQLDQVEIDAMWDAVCVGYGELYNAIETPEQKVKLQLVLTSIGTALVNGSTCQAPPTSRLSAMTPRKQTPPTWKELGDAIKKDFRGVVR